MDVLIVTPVAPDPTARGAIPLLLDALVRGLAPSHRLTVAFPTATERDLAAVESLATAGIETLTAARGDRTIRRRAHLARRRLASDWPWRTVWFHAPALQVKLSAAMAERRFDVVLLEDAATSYVLDRSLPLVVTDHEVVRTELGSVTGRSLRERLLQGADRKRFAGHALKVWDRADVIQVFTRADAAAALAAAPGVRDRLRVVPFGLTLPDPPTLPVIPGSLLFVGNFSHPPNVDAALWLVGEILPRVPGASLVLAGSEMPAAVRDLAGPRVRLEQNPPDVLPLLARAAISVAPLRTGGGMRMKVLQSLGAGRATVTTTLGAAGLDIGGPPPLLVADTDDEFAEAIRRLVADEKLRVDLGRRARAHVAASYTAEAYASRVEASLHAAVAAHR